MSYKDYNLKSNNRAKYGPTKELLERGKQKITKLVTPFDTRAFLHRFLFFFFRTGPSVKIIEFTTHDAIHPGVKPIVVTGRLLLLLMLLMLMMLLLVAGS